MPPKYDAPLSIDSNAMETGIVSMQRLKPISRWRTKIIQRYGRIQHIKLIKCRFLNIRG